MSQLTHTDDIPRTIASKLDRVRRRDRGMRLARGLIVTGTVLLTAMMLAMFIDWLVVLFEPAWRTVLTFASLGVAGVTLILYGVLPVLARRKLSALAWDVDASVPELEERWSTVTELAESRDPQSLRGSERLIRQVRQEAEAMQDRVAPDRVVTANELRRNAFGLGVVAAVLLAVLVFSYDTTKVLLQRFWLPTQPITMTTVTSTTGDRVVPMREPLLLEAAAEGRLRDEADLWINAAETSRSITLHPAADDPGHFVYKLKSVEEPFTYRVRCGDGQTDWHTITPVERPNIAQVRFRIIPPAYTKLNAEESRALPRHTRALEGSRMELAILPTKSIASLTLRFDEDRQEKLTAGAEGWYHHETTLIEDTGFSVALRDEHGLENLAPPQCRVAVYPDKPPSVEIVSPDDEIVVRPDDTIEIEYKARDDHGIADAEVVVTIERMAPVEEQMQPGEEGENTGAPEAVEPAEGVADGSEARATTETHIIPISLDGAKDAKNIHDKVAVDLKAFDLEHGEELSYMIRVRDTHAAAAESGQPGKPQDPMENALASAQDGQQTPFDPNQDQRLPGEQNGAPDPQDPQQAAQQQAGQPPNGQPQPSQQQSGQQQNGQPQPGQQQSGQQQNGQPQPGQQQSGQSQNAQPQPGQHNQPSNPSGRQGDQQQNPENPEQQPSDPHKARVAENDQQPPGNQQASASNSGRNKPSEPSDPSNRPPDNMTRRMLDLEKDDASCSKKQHLKVDKWVGRFEGQQREKLQLAINGFLKRLDAELEAAQKPAEALLDHVRPVAQTAEAEPKAMELLWAVQEDEKLRTSRDHLERAVEVTDELKAVSADTPYAFIGLQLDDIALFHIGPARVHLAEAHGVTDKPAELFHELQQGAFHIARARELLASLTRKYEAVKREEELAEKLEHLAEMHQVFVEDMHMLLKSNKPGLNPRTGEMIEMDISDEYKKAIEDYYARLKEVMDELAKILAEDPELLRRYMAMMRNQCSTIRDQLTELAQRQVAIRDDTAGWIKAAADGRPALMSKFEAQRVYEQLELAELTAQFNDDVATWTPDDAEDEDGHLETLAEMADEAARQAREISRLIGRDGIHAGQVPAESLIDLLFHISDEASMAMSSDKASDNVIHFSTRRLEGVERLTHRYRGWLVKVKNLEKNRFGRGAAYDQELLHRDTMTFGDKLDVRVGPLSQLSEEIGKKMRALEQLISGDLSDQQIEATVSLRLEDLKTAAEHEQQAVELFAGAEEMFDEILTLVEKTIAEQNEGQSPGGVKPPPTLEQLLAMLEREQDACEKLGAVLKMNLAIMTDTALPGEQSGSGAGQGQGTGSGQGQGQAQGEAQGQGAPTPGGRGPMQQSEQARQLADALARAAQARLAENAREMEKAQQQAEAEARRLADSEPGQGTRVAEGDVEPGAPVDETETHVDWATFVSRLDADLQQARDHVPPERYREAVDAYLRSISEMSSNSSAPTK